MKKVFLAALAGGFAMFLWSTISWMVLPWHNATITTIPSGEEIAQIMKNDDLPRGIYHFPGMGETEAETMKMMKRAEAGPNVNFMVYSPQGSSFTDPMPYLWGFILNFLGALLAAFWLSKLGGNLPDYSTRVAFVASFGVAIALMGNFVEWNWWKFALDYTLVMVADNIIMWSLAGLAIAKIIPART